MSSKCQYSEIFEDYPQLIDRLNSFSFGNELEFIKLDKCHLSKISHTHFGSANETIISLWYVGMIDHSIRLNYAQPSNLQLDLMSDLFVINNQFQKYPVQFNMDLNEIPWGHPNFHDGIVISSSLSQAMNLKVGDPIIVQRKSFFDQLNPRELHTYHTDSGIPLTSFSHEELQQDHWKEYGTAHETIINWWFIGDIFEDDKLLVYLDNPKNFNIRKKNGGYYTITNKHDKTSIVELEHIHYSESKNRLRFDDIIISSALAQKLGLKIGDPIIITRTSEKLHHL